MSLFGDPSDSQQFGPSDVWHQADTAMGFVDARHIPEAHTQSKAVLSVEQEVGVINDTAELEESIRSSGEPLHTERPFFGALSSSTWKAATPRRADQSLTYSFPTDKAGALQFKNMVGESAQDRLHPAYAEGQWEYNQRDVSRATVSTPLPTAPMRQPTLLLSPGEMTGGDGSSGSMTFVLLAVAVLLGMKLLLPTPRTRPTF